MTAATIQMQRKERKNIGLEVPVEMFNSLEALRRREGERSISALVRRLIDEGFERRSIS